MPTQPHRKHGRVAPGLGKAPVWAWILLVFAGTVWSVTFSLAKLATQGGAHPLGITFWQAAIGAALLLSYHLLKRRRLPLDRFHLRFYLVCGLLGTAIPSALYFMPPATCLPVCCR